MPDGMKSIYNTVMENLKLEKTKIAKRAFDVLDRKGIADITEKDVIFWFESYSTGNDCGTKVYNYLIKYIKRNFNLKYISEIIP